MWDASIIFAAFKATWTKPIKRQFPFRGGESNRHRRKCPETEGWPPLHRRWTPWREKGKFAAIQAGRPIFARVAVGIALRANVKPRTVFCHTIRLLEVMCHEGKCETHSAVGGKPERTTLTCTRLNPVLDPGPFCEHAASTVRFTIPKRFRPWQRASP